MPIAERTNRADTSVANFPPFRILVTLTAALLIATLIASSTAHGLTLGDAVAQSALGSPLRAVIPVAAAPGVSLQPGCFRVAPVAGDNSPSMVTARVSLERAPSATRLVVTTPNPVNEPAIRFSIRSGCDGVTERVYALLLDPPVAGAFTAVAVTPTTGREPNQERPVTRTASARQGSALAGVPETGVVRAPAPTEQQAAPTLSAPEPSAPVRAATAGAVIPAVFRQVAGSLPAAAGTSSPPNSATVGGTRLLVMVVAAGLAAAGLIALVVLLTRRRFAQPEFPPWTRSPAVSGPRSFADLSAGLVTLANTSSYHGAITQSALQRPTQKPAAAAPAAAEGSTPRGQPRHALVDPSTIDTLLDDKDADIVEERAVREAWAAARSDVEREMDGHASEMDGNAILQAIEEAERDFQLAPTVQAQSAIERALDDDLLQPQRRR